MKKIFILLITIVCLLSVCGCDSIVYSDGFILYHTGGEQYNVFGLTEEGRQQAYIIVPSYVNGHKVAFLKLGSGFDNMGNVKKVYIPYDIIRWRDHVLATSTTKVFIFSNCIHDLMSDYTNLYISSWLFENVDLINPLDKDVKLSIINHSHIANVSFHFNYEGSPNEDYYWIDDYDYEQLISFIPPNPTREGYTFAGWYKESECINEWIFNKDKLPEKLYDESGNVIFREIVLYAKWLDY